MEGSFGMRKGTWTEEEDILLTKCIDKFGEGEWNQVPHRAGLNRCRKSCRQRWLNYLKPNIKRGNFGTDEVDLLLRLHRLLGNRWSMIAGRLPGRTANDVKNYWNTHLKKNVIPCIKDVEEKAQDGVDRVKVIKPRPRTISKNLTWLCQKSRDVEERFDQPEVDVANNVRSPAPIPYKLSELMLSDDKEGDETATFTKNIIGLDEELNTNFWLDEIGPEATNTSNFDANEYLTNWMGDLSNLDTGVWDFFPN